MAMSPGIHNLGGGVDSGGAESIGAIQRGDKLKWARSLERRPLAVVDLEYVTVASWGEFAPLAVTLQEVAGIFPMGWFDRAAPPPAPDLHRLLTKSLCTLQALVSNMEESGEGVEHVARAMCEVGKTVPRADFRDLAQAAITAVLGTFDLEALKTLVGEIEEVRGRAA
jgi:hypothetical protein